MIPARPTVAEVLGALGIASPPAYTPEARSPWFVEAFVGFAAWLSGLLLMLFLFLADLVQSEVAAIVTGSVLVAIAIGLRWSPRGEHVFVNQLALALVIAGEGLVCFGLVDVIHESVAYLACALVFAGTLIGFPSPIHRLLATIGVGLCVGAFVHDLNEDLPLHLAAAPLFAAAVVLFDREATLEGSGVAPFRLPVAYGALLGTGLLLLFPLWSQGEQLGYTVATTVGVTAVVAVWLARAVVPEVIAGVMPEDSRLPALAAAVVGLVGLLTLPTPGIVASLGVLLLAFHRRQALLFALGTCGLAGFLFWFYRDLDLTLWLKALVLVASGLVLLGVRAALVRTEAA